MLRIKVVDRYLVREITAPFLIGLAAFLTVLCLNMAYFVLDLIVDKEAPLEEILQIIALRVPLYLVLAMPVAVLVASSLALSRITRDRELIALRLAGLSLWRLLLPFAVFGAVLSVGSFAAEEYVSPVTNHLSDNKYRRLLLESNVPSLTPDTFFRTENRVFYFHKAFRVGKHTLQLQQVMMYQLNGNDFPEIWIAREALVNGDVWTLKHVVLHHLDEHGHAFVDMVPRNDVVMDLHRDVSLLVEGQKLPEEMTAAQLRAQIQYYEKLGIHNTFVSQQEYEYWAKYTLPFACLICAIIGVPLNIRFARLGGFMGIFLALVSIFFYYNFMLVARALAYNGTIPAIVGAWLPDLVFGIICIVLVYREL